MTERPGSDGLLLVDTCGERGSVALARGGRVAAQVDLPERAASAGLLVAVRELLAAQQLSLAELTGVGVVSGPGSFTGVRVGLAVCKGLCEAANLPLAAVSRLVVLAHVAGLQEGFAVLRAGRDQLYLGQVAGGVSGREWLGDVSVLAAGRGEIVYAEPALEPLLRAFASKVRYVSLSAGNALAPVVESLALGGSPLALVDANYVRDEEAIYARPHAG